MEVAPGIHRLVAPLGDRINAIHLFVGTDAALVVDTGLEADPAGTIAPYLDRIGLDPARIRYVVNTHGDFDHMGGNASIRRLAGRALLMCGEADRPLVEDVERMIAERYGEFAADHGLDDSDDTKAWIRDNATATPIDIGLTGGEQIHLGDGWHLEVLHTPGHSLGSVSVWDPRSRSLAIGDAVLWNAVLLADGAPAFPPTYRFVELYAATIQRLQAMPIDRLLTSHYPLYEGSAVAGFLAESRAYVDRVDDALRTGLATAAPANLASLTTRLGPVLGEWPTEASQYLCYPLLGHLERLERQRVVVRVRGRESEVAWRFGP
jgi:glyoxylase-like metal-dependent hydrolase (beta-lactamase superfamily II)